MTVTVFGETDLTGVYDVNPLGNLDMPLIGAVRAVGRAPAELGRIIADRYKSGKFLDQPKVTVAVVEYTPVYIFGEVAKPGQYSYRSGLNAIAAVTEAGGLTYRGSRDSVLIQHRGEQAWTEYPLSIIGHYPAGRPYSGARAILLTGVTLPIVIDPTGKVASMRGFRHLVLRAIRRRANRLSYFA